MPKQITIKEHLSLDELESRYRQAKDPVERSHFQIIWLLAKGERTRAVVANTGYCAIWIQKLARRYNQGGPKALGDRRKGNPGAAPLLNREQQRELWQALQSPPRDGGLWTGQKVADWITARIGRKVRFQQGWEYLRRLGMTLQQPRPSHRKADVAAQEAFKKTSRTS